MIKTNATGVRVWVDEEKLIIQFNLVKMGFLLIIKRSLDNHWT